MIARLVDALSNGVAWVITTPLFWGLEHADTTVCGFANVMAGGDET